jgi:hypothetical protein
MHADRMALSDVLVHSILNGDFVRQAHPSPLRDPTLMVRIVRKAKTVLEGCSLASRPSAG